MLATLIILATAHGAEVDFTCSPEVDGSIIGLPPLEVRCVAELPLEGSWDEIVWSFGDGTTVSGDGAVSHTYDATGQFTVAVSLEAFEAPVDTGLATEVDEPAPDYLEQRKYGYVTVCGKPQPKFSYLFKGGLDYQMVNTTQPMVNCIDEVSWSVIEGDKTSGVSIVDPQDTWEPRFTLPEEGTYTFVLSMGGIAGTGSSRLTVDANYGLTEELDNVRAQCATVPASALGWLAVGGVLLGMRRRR